MDRITAIHKSLTTFVCGLIGFLPVIGIVPAIFALRGWIQVSTRYGKQWNPASAYLSWGARLGLLGLLDSVLLLSVAVLALCLGGFK